MKKLLFICIAIFSISTAISQTEVESITLPDTLVQNNVTLKLNGAGVRKKALLLKLYVGGLYLKKKSTDADSIVAANENMSIRLVITSRRVSSNALVNAIGDGFETTTNGNTAQFAKQIESLGSILSDDITYNDTFDVSYQKENGIVMYKNSYPLGTVIDSKDNLKFKQAFFGIWLGEKPADKNLKEAMLGIEE